MSALDNIKEKSKDTYDAVVTQSKQTLDNITKAGTEEPAAAKKWGVTAVAGLGGALALGAVAKGVLGLAAILANPGVAITAGAVGGGILGYRYITQAVEGNTEAGTADAAA
ncbi:MAG: hypothetical protein AAF702_12150 [Chloroflexota bacterium]